MDDFYELVSQLADFPFKTCRGHHHQEHQRCRLFVTPMRGSTVRHGPPNALVAQTTRRRHVEKAAIEARPGPVSRRKQMEERRARDREREERRMRGEESVPHCV